MLAKANAPLSWLLFTESLGNTYDFVDFVHFAQYDSVLLNPLTLTEIFLKIWKYEVFLSERSEFKYLAKF